MKRTKWTWLLFNISAKTGSVQTERNGIERNRTKGMQQKVVTYWKRLRCQRLHDNKYKLAHLLEKSGYDCKRRSGTESNGTKRLTYKQITRLGKTALIHLLMVIYGTERRSGTESNGTKRLTYKQITRLGKTALIHLLMVINGTERNGKQWNQKTYLQTNYSFG